MKLKEDRRTAGGLAVACDGDLIAISGTCTGTNLYFFDQITRPDVPFTLHIQVLAGSSTGAGMYFTPDTLVAFKTQTRYFSNGAPDWKGTSLWLTNNTIFTDDFTCRIWATPGDSPEIPYENIRSKYRACRRKSPCTARRKMNFGIPITSCRVQKQKTAPLSLCLRDGFTIIMRSWKI